MAARAFHRSKPEGGESRALSSGFFLLGEETDAFHGTVLFQYERRNINATEKEARKCWGEITFCVRSRSS